jgi:hypothetical protein
LAYQIESGNCVGNKNGYSFFNSGNVFGVAAAYNLSNRSIFKSTDFLMSTFSIASFFYTE